MNQINLLIVCISERRLDGMINEYIEQYGKRLYGLCMVLCKNKYDADDLYQDTWLKVVRYINQYDNSQQFEPWLTRICVNTYKNTWRRISRSPIFNTFSSNEEKDAIINNIAYTEKNDYSDLHSAIDNLPDKFRLAVILYYFEDMDINKVAKVMSIPQGTVKSRLSKARKMLREVLKDETDLQF